MAVNGQRRFRNQQGRQGRQEPDAGYGAPQAEYGQPQADASSLSESQHGDHEGLGKISHKKSLITILVTSIKSNISSKI